MENTSAEMSSVARQPNARKLGGRKPDNSPEIAIGAPHHSYSRLTHLVAAYTRHVTSENISARYSSLRHHADCRIIVLIAQISVVLTTDVHINHPTQRTTEGFTIHNPDSGLLTNSGVKFDG